MKKYLLIIFLAGCTTAQVQTETNRTPWRYDGFVKGNVSLEMKDINPGDLCPVCSQCPIYSISLNFWPALIHATAEAESGLNPLDDYKEKFTADDGTAQISSGLMQLSLDDAKRGTPYCSKITAGTIHDEMINLGCSMEIMDHLVRTSSGSLRERLGKYWSTIRDHKIDEQMKDLIPECFGLDKSTELDMMDAP